MKSCGCLKGAMISKSKIRHELIDTRSYGIWEGMKNRCQNPRNRNYANYGGRGITVCERWQGFTAFFVDMGEAPPGLSLDRIDNDKGYSPDNCRWATALEQRLNQRPRGKNSSPRKRLATKTIPTEPMVIP